jgi:hypothetical protein
MASSNGHSKPTPSLSLTPRQTRRDEMLSSILSEIRIFLSKRHTEIAQQPLAKMEVHSHDTESPIARGGLQIMITRTSSFSCLIKYVWQPGRPGPDLAILGSGSSGSFRYVFDEEAEGDAAARKAQARVVE